jgi:hypothetical protein
MCGKSAVKLLNFDTLNDHQKQELKVELQKRSMAIQERLTEVKQALQYVEDKMKPKKKAK